MILTVPSPVRLYLFQLENTTIQIGETLYGLVVSYLIQMSDGTNVLMDTSIPADYQPPAARRRRPRCLPRPLAPLRAWPFVRIMLARDEQLRARQRVLSQGRRAA